MKLIEVKDYQEMSHVSADYLLSKVKNSETLTLGLATGGTPQGLYKELIRDHQQNGTSYQHVSSFNLDEYIGLTADHPNSYFHYMNENLFKHIDIDPARTYIPSGKTVDLEKECKAYDTKIQSLGGIDLQILGIGSNGHVGFNEPGTQFGSTTHIVELAPSTREANARYFDSIEDVPTHAITMGIASIIKSKEILLLVSGNAKQEALKRLMEGKISEDFPASILNKHEHVTVIADEEALALVKTSACERVNM
ncbi:glucosamine-6-phosphate deaminase [Rossellomorea sp. AcN35-11]|nr:glucosamine-6-phosphate deaminase [Rossellomorea aquimaris]WJV31220.1 glucosamine-6-phosphate deaminase [Rossellomorea sp. AcN35-11]